MKTLVIIVGPTASGKTQLALFLAKELNTVIISADSRQIYREMKIGTAVPAEAELKKVKHFLIGTISIHEYYNASMFELDANALLEKLFIEKEVVIMAGGSGLYINAVCSGIDDFPATDPELRQQLIHQYHEEGIESLRSLLKKLDPDYYEKADLKNYKRILKALEVCLMTGRPYSTFLTGRSKERPYRILQIGIRIPRKILYERIDHRVDKMIECGLPDEARSLYPFRTANALNTVGYKELFDHFDGLITFEEAIRLIKRNTRRYARKQISWFARDKNVRWFDVNEEKEILQFIHKKIS